MKKIDQSMPEEWLTAEPASAATWLGEVTAPWWIAGGWALDLYLGRTHRAHADLDVGALRRDIRDLLRGLSGWEHFEACNGSLFPLRPGELPGAEVHSLWCCRRGEGRWALEIMLDDSDGDSWVFRRDAAIRRPLSTLTRRTQAGISYLAPEVQLLYKARAPRPVDQEDFERVSPELDSVARGWLFGALARAYPGHPWLGSNVRATSEHARGAP